MMDLAGSKKIVEGVMTTMGQQLFDGFKKMRPDIPPQVWDVVLARLKNPETLQGLLSEIVPIYQRHLCSDEIEQIIVFYRSPAGHKLSAEMPAIQKEAAEAGQGYARRMSEQLMQDIQEELAKQGAKSGTPPKAADSNTPKQ
jgi:uncharacterized protein